VTSESTGNSNARARLEQAIVELLQLDEVLLSGDLEPRILADFRDAPELSVTKLAYAERRRAVNFRYLQPTGVGLFISDKVLTVAHVLLKSEAVRTGARREF
jgi:hypothetical protein